MKHNFEELQENIYSPEQCAYDAFFSSQQLSKCRKPFVTQAINFWKHQPYDAIWGGWMYFPSPSLAKLLRQVKEPLLFDLEPFEKILDRKTQFFQLCYLFRLNLYTANWKQLDFLSNQLKKNSETQNEKIEACYLKTIYVLVTRGLQLDSMLNELNNDFENCIIESNEFRTVSLYFHISLMLINHYEKLNSTKDVSYLIKRAQLCLEQPVLKQSAFTNLASARLRRHMALLEMRSQNFDMALKIFNEALCLIDERSSMYQENLFLYQETKIRILEAFYKCCNLMLDYPKALMIIKAIREIDPICPYLGVKHARSAIACGQLSDAKEILSKIEPISVLEKEYIHYLLIRLGSCTLSTFDRALSWSAKSFFSQKLLKEFSIICGNFFKDKVSIKSKNFFLNSTELLPDIFKQFPSSAPDYLQKLGCDLHESFSDILKNSLTYARHNSFWTLELPSQPTPYFNYVPVVAFKVYNDMPSPWFDSLYLQRSLVSGTRRELLLSIYNHVFWQSETLKKEENFLTFTHFSADIQSLRDAYNNFQVLSLLQRSYLARAISSLGFNENSLIITEWSLSDNYSLEHSYYLYTHIYLAFLNPNTSLKQLSQKLRILFDRLPNQIETLRLRLNCAILGSIIAGRMRNINFAQSWREIAINLLSLIKNTNEFSEIEKLLLTSRTFRAISYLPWLLNDKQELLADAQKCEAVGREAVNFIKDKKNPEKLSLIVSENIYPMLETLSRIYVDLGDKKKALDAMFELCNEVDPLDSKTHLQLGDLLEQQGNFDDAYKHFLIAANLGGTHMAISWFRSGIMAEKIGDNLSAERYYLNSWRANPAGISPLKRLIKINEYKNNFIANWALNLLKKIQ